MTSETVRALPHIGYLVAMLPMLGSLFGLPLTNVVGIGLTSLCLCVLRLHRG